MLCQGSILFFVPANVLNWYHDFGLTSAIISSSYSRHFYVTEHICIPFHLSLFQVFNITL